LDGSPHAPEAIRSWLGDSRGHWDGDTLVVDTTNFSDRPGLTQGSRNLHVVERFTRLDADTLLYHFTVDDPTVWTDPRGDPVESTLSVFKSFTGRDPIRGDGSVDPGLIGQYREGAYLSILMPLLNPMFFHSLGAFGADRRENRGLMEAPWVLGDERFAWSWGTHFHPSPLGYELHLVNYLRVRGRLLILSLKTGEPYRNDGIGVEVPGLIEYRGLRVGFAADGWDQDHYGQGASFMIDARYRTAGPLDLVVRGGWKSDGYLVGRRVDESALILAGLSYRF